MSRQPPPPPPFFQETSHTRSTNTRQNVTGDSAYIQAGPAPGHVYPSQLPRRSGYSQQYSSSQTSATSSSRSTLSTTPAYDHASSYTQPPARPPYSGSTSYNPSFPVPAVPERQPSTNSSGPPPPAPLPISHRVATMSIPVHPNTASSMPYDMRPPNTMPPSSQSGVLGGPQSTTQGYLDVHERDDDPSNFSNEDLEHSREGTRHSGGYMRDRSPPNCSSAGRQQGGHGGNTRRTRPRQSERLRCMICRRVTTRADVEYQRGYCAGGHMGQWQRAQHNEDHYLTR